MKRIHFDEVNQIRLEYMIKLEWNPSKSQIGMQMTHIDKIHRLGQTHL